MDPKKRKILNNNWRRVKTKAEKFWQEIKRDPLGAWDRCRKKKVVMNQHGTILVGRYWEYVPEGKNIPMYTMDIWFDFYEDIKPPNTVQPTKEEERNEFLKWMDGEAANAVSSTGKFVRLMVFDEVVPRCWELRKRLNPPPQKDDKKKEKVVVV